LRDAGLITDRKDGKWVEYRLKDKNSSAVAEKFIELISTMLNDDEIIRKDILNALDADRELISTASILPR
jgi:DNA-binding transcriptional ArsR family regulator